MIVVNRIYTVLSVVIIILITVFYLLHVNSGHNKEYLLYIQNNSSFALQHSATFSNLNVLNSTSLVYNINIGKVYLEGYGGKRTGRFILLFSLPGQIDFKVTTDTNENIGTVSGQNLTPYYPFYIDFNAPGDATQINLQYKTSSQTIVLYKLSVEFF